MRKQSSKKGFFINVLLNTKLKRNRSHEQGLATGRFRDSFLLISLISRRISALTHEHTSHRQHKTLLTGGRSLREMGGAKTGTGIRAENALRFEFGSAFGKRKQGGKKDENEKRTPFNQNQNRPTKPNTKNVTFQRAPGPAQSRARARRFFAAKQRLERLGLCKPRWRSSHKWLLLAITSC